MFSFYSSFLYIETVFNKAIIPLVLVGYEIHVYLVAICHLISNVRPQNNNFSIKECLTLLSSEHRPVDRL